MKKIKKQRPIRLIKPEALIYTLSTNDNLDHGSIDDVLLDWFYKIENHELAINEKSIIFVDQSNMISTRLMHKLLKIISDSNSKLVLFGLNNSRFIQQEKFIYFGEA